MTIAQALRSSDPLPLILKAFSVTFLILGPVLAVVGIVVGVGRVNEGDTSLLALQNFSTALGGILVALYGTVILRRNRVALGRWWFLAAWPMNVLAPTGLFLFASIIASTLIIRKKYVPLFSGYIAEHRGLP